MRWVRFFTIVALSFSPISAGFCDHPESILSEQDVEATVYIVETFADKEGIADFRYAWIPADIIEACLNGSFKECQERDRCRQYPSAQKCDKDMSDCKPIVNPGCEPYVTSPEEADRSLRKTLPPFITASLSNLTREQVKALLKAAEITTQESSAISPSEAHSLQVTLHFTEWTNGASVSITKINSVNHRPLTP